MPSNLHNEPELLKRIADGDENAFRQLFDVFMQPLCYFGFQLIQDKEEAKDIAISIFQKLWENQERFSTIETVKGYLFTSMRNGCLNYLRHLKVEARALRELTEPGSENAKVEALMIQAEVMQKIYAEIETLSPQLREILLLNLVHGLSVREIAEKLQISESHVRADRSRAVGYLRTALAKKGMLELSLVLFPLFNC